MAVTVHLFSSQNWKFLDTGHPVIKQNDLILNLTPENIL